VASGAINPKAQEVEELPIIREEATEMTIGRLLMVRVPNAEWEYPKEHFEGFVKEAMKKLQLPYDDFDIKPEGVGAGGSRHRGWKKWPQQRR
jgi:hypothetical protein